MGSKRDGPARNSMPVRDIYSSPGADGVFRKLHGNMQSLDGEVRAAVSPGIQIPFRRRVVIGKVDMQDTVPTPRQFAAEFNWKCMSAKFIYQNSHIRRHSNF